MPPPQNLTFVGTPSSFRSSHSQPQIPTPPSPTSPSTPTTPSSPRRSRRSSNASSVNNPRLSIIREDTTPTPPPLAQGTTPGGSTGGKGRNRGAGVTALPAVPQLTKTQHRPWSRRFLAAPPRYKDEKPPTYSFVETAALTGKGRKGRGGEKLDELKDKPFFARRGGWRRMCIISLVVLVLVIALAVGLGVGLARKKNHSSGGASSPGGTNTSNTTLMGPFPIGAWTFTTYLLNTSTDCASTSASWTCPTGQLYSQSPQNSQVLFQWVINSTSSSSNDNQNLTIASTANPFVINFDPIPLILTDPGSPDERYTFTASGIQKATYPSGNVKCFFNTTSLTAHLYTRKTPTISLASPSSSSKPSATAPASPPAASAGGTYQPWLYAVDAVQSVPGGDDIPQCFEWDNGVIGAEITDGYEPKSASDECSCGWASWGDAGGKS